MTMAWNKYGAKKVTWNNMVFDSKHEYARYQALMLMVKAGLISDLQRQVKYVLIPKQIRNNKVAERECSYIADFVYKDTATGETIVEDAKGIKTPEYRIKKKLMLWVHGLRIKEV